VSRCGKPAVTFGLLATVLAGCGPLGVMSSVAGTTIAGTYYVRNQTVERTFVAPMPEVEQACRRALLEMGFTIQGEERRGDDYVITASASDVYVVEVTMTLITAKAVRVAINADSLPERDKATAGEIISQMTAALSPGPDPRFVASPAPDRELPALPLDRVSAAALPPPPPVVAEHHPPVEQELPRAPISAAPHPGVMNPTGPRIHSSLHDHPPKTVRIPTKAAGEPPDPHALYETAKRQYVQGDFSTAIAHFRTYLATPPDTGERPRALYWLGEALYSQREYADALLQFEIIRRDYPLSPEVPLALLRGAQAYQQLQERQQGRALLQTLVMQYPKSSEARVARTLLKGW